MTAPLVLVTRPGPEAAATAARLTALGYRCLVEPMVEIVVHPGPPLDLAGVQALLVTSGNGARALADRTPVRDSRAFAVGDATAETLRDRGFGDVESAAGDARDLAALVRQRCDPAIGALLHIRGNVVGADPAALLKMAGFAVRTIVLYETRTPSAFSRHFERTMRQHDLGYALFFSPRAGRTFVTLARAAGLAPECETIEACCLSAAVATAVEGVRWRAVRISVRPEQGALLALLPPAEDRDGSRGEHGE